MPEALIDITRLLDRRMQGRLPTGIDRVSLEYVRHFRTRATGLVRYLGRWIELSQPESIRLFDALLAPSFNFNHLVRRTVSRALPRCLGRHFNKPKFLFNTGHNGLERKDYLTRLQRSSLRPIFFFHDLIPVSHPEYCRPGEAAKHRIRLHTMLTMGRGILANSKATLEQLSEYADRHKLPLPPTAVAHLAPADLSIVDSCPMLNTPYFVTLGTIEPRKNHWMLLQIWRRLIEEMGDAAPRLVVIGQRGWECENVIDLLERCTQLRGFVFEYSSCTDSELATWMSQAQGLLFPSFTEGYGMPLVEALTLGVPVIASDIPVFHEIAGNVPEYVDPLDGLGWAKQIIAYMQADSPSRQGQLLRIQHYSTPTWETHFDQVEALLEQVRAL